MSERDDNSGSHSRVEIDLGDEHDRYHRQSLITWWDQERLANATILVVGAGALGNELVKNLVMIGVGRVLVVDMDRIENSNLSRCVFFRPGDDGRYKAETLAQRASELNPEIEVIPLVGDVRLAVGLAVYDEVDVVLGGLDNREARLFVNQACWKTSKPWVDGAIEGLMGVARVFEPPETACYECTLGERDYELINARRTCSLLNREDMLGGKVPTTATSASVVAAIQVQEAVKLLHRDRLDSNSLGGKGFQFVGLTHDSYVVAYGRDENCLSHDTYELERAECADPLAPFAGMLARAQELLGEKAILELEHEIAVSADCSSCGESQPINRPVDGLSVGAGLCPNCGSEWRLNFAHVVDGESPLAAISPVDLELPPADVVVGRNGTERCFFKLTGSDTAIETLLAARAENFEGTAAQ